MSYSTIYALAPGEPPVTLLELRNGHGSAPVIWNDMCQKYLGAMEFGYHDVIEDLWPLWTDLSIPEHQRAVLLMTYDLARISRANFQRAARDIRRYLEDFPIKVDRVNHWPTIAQLYESRPDCHSIGIQHTSVSDNPFAPDYDEETEEEIPVGWSETFEIYDDLDALKNGETA